MIKGGGGALTREKIVAAVGRKFVCIVDQSKLVPVLGKFPLPVEVIPMARSYVAREMVRLGGQPAWRMGFTTDNGNVILDVHGLTIATRRAGSEDQRRSPAWSPSGCSRARGADVILMGTDDGRADADAACSLTSAAGRLGDAGARSRYNGRMTNLNIPGLGTFADVAAYMQGVGEAARAAARDVARADTPRRTPRCRRWPRRSAATKRALLAANAEDVAAAKAAGHDAGVRRPADAHAEDDRRDGRRARRRSRRCPIPSARSPTCATARPASRSARCACRWAWSASSTNRGRT